MKKLYYWMAAAITAVSFTACNEEKIDDGSLVLGEDDAKEVTINRLGGVLEVPITATGEWTASLPADCRWAKVVTKQREGSGKVVLNVGYLDPKKAEDRRTELTVTAGNLEKTIRIRQYMGLNDGENAGSDSFIDDAWGDTMLGMGVSIINTGGDEDDMFKGCWVTNAENAQWIAQKNRRYGSIFKSSTSASDIGNEGVKEEDNTKYDTLGITASVSVTYGLFKLKVKGHYSSNENVVNNKVSYHTEYRAPRSAAWLGARDLASLVTMEINPDRYKGDAYWEMVDMQEQALAPGFYYDRLDIMDAFDEEFKENKPKADSTWTISDNIESLLKSLDANYGPVFVSRVVMGGSTFLSLEYDSVFVADTLNISGSIDVDITSGLLNVKAGVSAGYTKNATEIMKKSQSTFAVRGGKGPERSAVINALTLKNTQIGDSSVKSINVDSVHTALAAWSASIPNGAPKQSNKEDFAAITYGYSPIWTFFGKYSAYVKEFFIRYYKHKDTLVDLESM